MVRGRKNLLILVVLITAAIIIASLVLNPLLAAESKVSVFIPGTYILLPPGQTAEQALGNIDLVRSDFNLPAGVSAEQVARYLKGEGGLSDEQVQLLKGLNPEKFGPPGDPYPVSQYKYKLFNEWGDDQIGSILADMTLLANNYLVIVNSLAEQGKYDVAVERLLDVPVPKNVSVTLYATFKRILEAKRCGNDDEAARAIWDNLGELLKETSQKGSAYASVEKAVELASTGDPAGAAKVLNERIMVSPDALLRAYKARLELEAGNRYQAARDIEAAIAMAPKNMTFYKWAGIIYNQAGQGISKAFINGIALPPSLAPKAEKSHALVPLVAAAYLGADVTWDPDARTASITRPGITIQVRINSDTAYVNGRQVALDVPARIINSRTYVPLRFIAENLDCTSIYDSSSGMIVILPGKKPEPNKASE